ncbi:ABC transporter permease [Labrys wisconsinensis]|uniref:ABC transporter permease n=1 Tax=Labrys wisconsinensis TaxID=425677 RepID=UPI00352071D4
MEAAMRAGSLLALLVLWQAAAVLAASRALPSPAAVAQFLAAEALHGDLLANIGATLRRVVMAFVVAMAVGTAIGVGLGRSPAANTAFDPWLMALLNAPALVVAVLCYIWLGLGEAAAVTAVALNKIPNVVVILREGARSLDPGLEEMARVYRFSPATWARHVLAPQLAPFLAAAARSGLALVWKIVLLVELLGRPDGVGYAISVYFQLFDVTAVLGYAVAFMAVMLAVEFLVLQPLEARARRWRLAAA